MSDWWNAVYIVLLIGFWIYLGRGMRKTSRYDNPVYIAKQEQRAERELVAAEMQAKALADIARHIERTR